MLKAGGVAAAQDPGPANGEQPSPGRDADSPAPSSAYTLDGAEVQHTPAGEGAVGGSGGRKGDTVAQSKGDNPQGSRRKSGGARGVSNGKPAAQPVRPILLLLAGVPGSGKSTFSRRLLDASPVAWVHVNQDAISNGRPGSRQQCLTAVGAALDEGACCVVDRCHGDTEQRSSFLELAGQRGVVAHCVALQPPLDLCARRVASRTDHPGGVQGDNSKRVVYQMAKKQQQGQGWPPAAAEGFASVMDCHDDADAAAALRAWAAYGSNVPPATGSDAGGEAGSEAPAVPSLAIWAAHAAKRKAPPSGILSFLKPRDGKGAAGSSGKAAAGASGAGPAGSSAPRLPFQAASKAPAAASARPRAAAPAAVSSSPARPVAATAAPGGGGAAHASAAAACGGAFGGIGAAKAGDKRKAPPVPEDGGETGSAEPAAKRLAKSMAASPPAPVPAAGQGSIGAEAACTGPRAASPAAEEGIRLGKAQGLDASQGPPHQSAGGDGASDGDGGAGSGDGGSGRLACAKHGNGAAGAGAGAGAPPGEARNAFTLLMASASRKAAAAANDPRATGPVGGASSGGHHRGAAGPGPGDMADPRFRLTAPWAQALRVAALNPEQTKLKVVLFKDDKVLMIADQYPKARHHALVLSVDPQLRSIADLRKEHIPLLQHMRRVAQDYISEQRLAHPGTAAFKLGFHAVPSMCQLHMHVISQDFDSPALNKRKHWNSFTTRFFLPLEAVLGELEARGRLVLLSPEEEKELEGQELRCHGCSKAFKNIPDLKRHIVICEEVKQLPGL